MLNEIREKHLLGGIKGEPLHDDGVFWPISVAPRGIRTAATVKRHLKASGYAVPGPGPNGNWILTDAGRTWLAQAD